jgi:hypothetical protein
MAYIAIVVVDSWHIANGQHFGDIVYDYQSTPVLFPTRMEAIQNAFDVLSKTYSGVTPVSKKGLKDDYNNELSYFGREFHIISFDVRNAE